MPYNGSGTYNAPSSPGAFNPATAAQQATPTAWNALLADISAALSMVITTDGQSAVTNDIPFGGHKLTGLGNATLATDAMNAGQVASNGLTAVNDTGTANNYTIAPAFAITAYAAYQRYQFKALNANTGGSSLAVSGLAGQAIKHLDGSALLQGDILAGELVDVMYDGTNFQLLSATGLRGMANTWRAAQTFNAATTMAAISTMSAAPFNEAVRVDVASAATADIGAAAANYVRITGTTTITSLGTIASGVRRKVVFGGALTLTYNATSLILPAASNILTAAGDCAEFESEGSGNWRCTQYQRASGVAIGATTLANSLPADVTLNNVANYFDGPSVAQGTAGTWQVSGTVTVQAGAISDTFYAKLWDGTTVIDSAAFIAAAAVYQPIALSGALASPAGNLRISVKCTTSTTTKIIFNATGESKDSTVTAIRIG